MVCQLRRQSSVELQLDCLDAILPYASSCLVKAQAPQSMLAVSKHIVYVPNLRGKTRVHVATVVSRPVLRRPQRDQCNVMKPGGGVPIIYLHRALLLVILPEEGKGVGGDLALLLRYPALLWMSDRAGHAPQREQ